MKNKIKVVHHSNQLGLGGTEKDMQLFCKYMDKDLFEVHALTRRFPVPPHRIWIDHMKSFFSMNAQSRVKQYALSTVRVPAFQRDLGEEHVHFYTLRTLPKVMQTLSPQILHVHHSGVSEVPINQPQAMQYVPIIFTINGFGFQDTTIHDQRVTKILFPSFWVKEGAALWSKGDNRCGVLYCPIEKPYTDQDLRAELGIKKETFVLGRVGRNADDIHDIISLKAYREIESEETLFLVLSAPQQMKKDAQALGIKNIRYLEPSVDEIFLSRFYNAIDVLAHARLDGETFGCVIAEAMIHRKPVVTHQSHIRKAQAELVDQASGFIVDQNDWKKYAEYLKLLKQNRSLCLQMGAAAEKRALENFEAELITKKLEKLYLEELKKKGIPVPQL